MKFQLGEILDNVLTEISLLKSQAALTRSGPRIKLRVSLRLPLGALFALHRFAAIPGELSYIVLPSLVKKLASTSAPLQWSLALLFIRCSRIMPVFGWQQPSELLNHLFSPNIVPHLKGTKICAQKIAEP